MTKKQTVTVEPKVFVFDKFSVRLLTMFKAKYVLWPDARYGPTGHRWAYRTWHDDGLGTATHGAEFSLEDAAQAVTDNFALRKEIATWEAENA